MDARVEQEPSGSERMNKDLSVELNRMILASTDEDKALIMDMLWKAARKDWHGVSDAANDLRVSEATCKR